MFTVCYAAKAGSGATVTAAAMALAEQSLLVDLAGDVLDVLGLPSDGRPGIHDWLRSEAEPDALDDLVVDAGGCRALPAGHHAPLQGAPADRLDGLWRWIRDTPEPTIVDAGSGEVPVALLETADHVLLVTRPCYLALRHAHMSAIHPTGVILINEPGRALDRRDVVAAIGAPLAAEIQLDPAIARAVDAGLLATSLPRSVRRAIRRVAA